MEQNMLNMNDKIYTNNNNILMEIVKELQQIINNSNENLTIKGLSNIIIQMNNMINDNKKNTQLIINHIKNLQNQMEQMNQNIKQININYFSYIINHIIHYKY